MRSEELISHDPETPAQAVRTFFVALLIAIMIGGIIATFWFTGTEAWNAAF